MNHVSENHGKIAVTGASGLVGKHLKTALQEQGHQVLSISRRSGDILWDHENRSITNPELLENLDALVHLSGENIAARRWNSEHKRKIHDSRVLGTRFLIESLKKLENPPKKFLCASAVGFYPAGSMDEVFDETSPPDPGFLGQTSSAWETEALKAEEFARTCRMRFGIILSPEGGALQKMLPPFRLGLGGIAGSGEQPFPFIDLEDVVRGILFLIQQEEAEGAYNFCAPECVSNREMTKALAQNLRRPALIPAPALALKMLLGEEMANALILKGSHVKPKALLNAGFQFKYPDIHSCLKHLLNDAE